MSEPEIVKRLKLQDTDKWMSRGPDWTIPTQPLVTEHDINQ